MEDVRNNSKHMEWVNTAEEYLGSFGWGARGKTIGISRMMNDADKEQLSRSKVFASTRPRGILSGFLTIVPGLGYAVYLPPVAAKIGPQRIRMRLSERVLRDGAIFSAYTTRDKRIIVEDILVWAGDSVWHRKTFEDRWNKLLREFVARDFVNDPVLQHGYAVELANHMPVQTIGEPEDGQLLEFIPNSANQKRWIWMPSARMSERTPTPQIMPTPTAVVGPRPNRPAVVSDAAVEHTVRKETSLGPDVYSVWKGDERLGTALIRTLSISKQLRLSSAEAIHVRTEWNRQFEKWEVVEVKSLA